MEIVETDHLWIPMPDGIRLAARLWRPRSDRPVPALLEYIPYRKTDMVRARDERNHPFFAAHHYASIRVDMRGSGDSEGHMPDMYSNDELADARHVIAWLARQPWCNGRVGMFGTSWGGTAALQASVDAPGPLKAIIAVCATHDRFEDDIHYMGGNFLSDTFEWGATLPAILASPPTMNIGPTWKEVWKDRIDKLSFPLENWLREKARGRYWRHGSVIHEASQLSVPILSIGGWSDRYSNSVMSLLEARPDLVWGVIGPWGHHYPDHGAPGPAIGFQQLALQWWDKWLKDGTEVTEWPRLRTWLRQFEPPMDKLAARNGRWIESGPPSDHTARQRIPLQTLTDRAAPWPVSNRKIIGLTSGETGYFGRSGGLPLDQGEDDAQSLVFETGPFAEDLVLYGAPKVHLSGTAKKGTVVVRLNDISPDGQSARISYGLRNLALDDSLDTQIPAESGEFEISIPLHTTAYLVQKGHRLRLAVSQSYWPLVVGIAPDDILISDGSLDLAVMGKPPTDLRAPLPKPKDLPLEKTHLVLATAPLERWRKTTATNLEIGWCQPAISVSYPKSGTTFGYDTQMVLSCDQADQTIERVVVTHNMVFARQDGTACIRMHLKATLAIGEVHVDATLTTIWNDEVFSQRNWDFRIPKNAADLTQ